MELTTAEYKQVEELAAINYSLDQIAMYIDKDYNSFLDAFNFPESKLKYHYDRGKLITQAEIDKANLKKAKDGSLASIQQWKKDSVARKLENIKQKVLYDNEQKELEQLQAFVEKGETDNLPAHLAAYYEQIDFMRALYNRNSKSYVISMARLKWPQLTSFTANKLYYETLNFFNLDNGVKSQAWANIYADRLDNMALISMEMNDLETARRLTIDAADLRGAGKNKSDDLSGVDLSNRVTLYVMDCKRVGIPEIPRKELAKFIDDLDITETQKSKYMREALVEDIPLILVEEDEES